MHSLSGATCTSTIVNSTDDSIATSGSGAVTPSCHGNDTSGNISSAAIRSSNNVWTGDAVHFMHQEVPAIRSSSDNSNGSERICTETQKPNLAKTTEKEANKNDIQTNMFNDDGSWILRLICSKSPEYQNLKKDCRKLKIEAVYAVRNEILDERYRDVVAATLEKDTFKGFHSVWRSSNSHDDIIRSGFEVGGVDVRQKHGAAMGTGAYVTTKPLKAAGYSIKSSPKDQIFCWMLFCELCETVDTITKDGGTAFVQPNKWLVRPVYVVHFRRPH